MGIYNRGKYKWVSYSIPKELAAEHGCKRLIRESTGTNDARLAAAFLAKRKRQIRDGTWASETMGGSTLTLATWVAIWNAKRVLLGLRAAKRDLEMLAPFLNVLGDRRLDEIGRREIARAVDGMRRATGRRGKAKGKAYAPMTIHRCYGVLRACFRAAVREGLVAASPCTLSALEGELPPRADADSAWRDTAIFSRKEILALISDSRVPEIRRVLYALTFYAGLRMGEAVARKWSDYNHTDEPLGRLYVATQHEGRKLKVDVPRPVPVHPALARILADWRERYALHYGNDPTDDDLIVRNTQGGRFLPNVTLHNLRHDLKTLKLRRRRFHDLRRSFISLAVDDGARGEILKVITHGRSRSMVFDQYKTHSWPALCAEVACLKVNPTHQPPTPKPPPKGGSRARTRADGRESQWN